MVGQSFTNMFILLDIVEPSGSILIEATVVYIILPYVEMTFVCYIPNCSPNSVICSNNGMELRFASLT